MAKCQSPWARRPVPRTLRIHSTLTPAPFGREAQLRCRHASRKSNGRISDACGHPSRCIVTFDMQMPSIIYSSGTDTMAARGETPYQRLDPAPRPSHSSRKLPRKAHWSSDVYGTLAIEYCRSMVLTVKSDRRQVLVAVVFLNHK
jgi:hypothetical protein